MKYFSFLQKKWNNLGITKKIFLAFGSIMVLIILSISICIILLSYMQHETERSFTNSSEIRSLVLELSWLLEESRGMEKDFFLQYNTIGFNEAKNKFLEPAFKKLTEVDKITAELGQLLGTSTFWKESDLNMELLFIAQFRHTTTMNEAVALITRLAQPTNGLSTRYFQILDQLHNSLHRINDHQLENLVHTMSQFGYNYMIDRQRPNMQSSINAAERIKDHLKQLRGIPANELLNHDRLLTDYMTVCEDIIKIDLMLRNKFTDFQLQSTTLEKITEKMVHVSDMEREVSLHKINTIFWIIFTSLIFTMMVTLVVVYLVTKLVGRSIAESIITMSEVVNRFEKGDLKSRLHMDRQDELGQLAGSFNRMAAKINSLINNLEDMIEYRTKNLIHINEQLKIEINEKIQSQAKLEESEKQIKASLKEKETLLQEIHHRVKNNMQVIASLIKLQMDKASDKKVTEILQESYGRVYAMSVIHETLYRSENLSSINIKQYMYKISNALLQSFVDKSSQVLFFIDSTDINLEIEKANPLGLVVNELISNSLKHAFPDERKGEIIIKIEQLDTQKVRLSLSDNGIGFPENLDWKVTDSLGLQLIVILVENQLDGTIQKIDSNGTTFIIEFPV